MAGKNSRPNKILPPLIGVMAFALLIFLLCGQFNAYKNARAALEKEKTACRQAQLTLQDLKEAEKQAAVLKDKLEKYQRMLPGEPDEDTLISDLDTCAAEADVNLQQIHFGSRLAKDGYTEMPLDLVLEGRYHDLLTFLEAIQGEGQRAVRIDSIKMSQGREEKTLVRADITASVFFISKKQPG